MSKSIKNLFPYGLQTPPGSGKGDALFYSLGIPGVYNGRMTSVHQDQFNNALMHGKNPNDIMPWGKKSTPAVAAQEVVNFTPNLKGRMRGGMMGLNYRLMR